MPRFEVGCGKCISWPAIYSADIQKFSTKRIKRNKFLKNSTHRGTMVLSFFEQTCLEFGPVVLEEEGKAPKQKCPGGVVRDTA